MKSLPMENWFLLIYLEVFCGNIFLLMRKLRFAYFTGIYFRGTEVFQWFSTVYFLKNTILKYNKRIKNIKQFDMTWKDIKILIWEISNNIFFCQNNKNFAWNVGTPWKRKYYNSFHNCCFSYILYLSPALLWSYQKKRFLFNW